ncbi:MAG: MBL fold metallo-hydrolase [Chloroflexota bacterium]
MKVTWLGHASFLITSESGTRIITDPYIPGGDLRYGEIKESADIVTVSHEHGDHNNVAAVQGNPEVVKGTTETKSIKFKGIPVYHDDAQGKERGKNTIFCFDIDGVNICHLGDLGHVLNDKEVAELGKVDILLMPVGGFYTIDAGAASQVCSQIKPGVIIPMHFKNERCTFPIAGVEEFLQGKDNVSRLDGSEVEFKAGELPGNTKIMVLKPAL